jgi:hypothetical protein
MLISPSFSNYKLRGGWTRGKIPVITIGPYTATGVLSAIPTSAVYGTAVSWVCVRFLLQT